MVTFERGQFPSVVASLALGLTFARGDAETGPPRVQSGRVTGTGANGPGESRVANSGGKTSTVGKSAYCGGEVANGSVTTRADRLGFPHGNV
jgi:hypothetical protein